MAKIQAPRRIRIEDFSPEQRAIIERISEAINTFNEDVYNVLNGNGIDFDNLNQQVMTVLVTLDGSGNISNEVRFTTTVKGKISGLQVINCVDVNNVNNFPIAQPFASFTYNGNIITIRHVAGLNPGATYRITVLVLP